MALERFDHVVVGAGVMGAATAMQLSRRGRTLLLEQHEFLHERGSSHGGSRIFRHAYEDSHHVQLAVAADRAWTELEERSGERLLLRTGGLDIGSTAHGELDPIEAALREAGRSVERLSAAQVHARFPAFSPADDQEALYQADAGILPASRAVATMLRVAAGEGAVLRDREPITELRPVADGVELSTPRGRYAADRVVVAAGPWLGKVMRELELPLHIERQQVHYVRVGADARAFAPERMPVFIDRRGGIYGFPLFENPLAIKVSDHEGAPRIDLDQRSFEIDPAREAATVAAAMALFPGLQGDVIDAVTCLYTKTPDERFILDRHPEHPQVVLAGGGSGHAFKFGALIGEIAADLATAGQTVHDIAPFALSRFR